ncbi:MAG: DEAD/DEAH box helicase family protein, partial [Candidatus Obscuribacterales bacterium]|nr:DEAD/DEAH box helicase family protein [Candidatus Obscuribacterales bacterium]
MIIYKFFNTVRPRDQLLTINPDESQGSDNSWFDQLNFQYPLRKYQSDIIELCNKKLANGEKELHIVAPPGSGKTIIGLQIISQFKCPSLVICPNTTIQSQWAQKLDLFLKSDFAQMARPEILGTHEDRPLKPITILTYQALSVSQKNENHFLESFAHNAWIEELAKNQSLNSGDAEIRILDLKKNNPKAFKKELARHTKRLRRNLTDVLKLEEVLHENALALIQQLKRQQFALVIFDECHHLTDYWASVMIHLVRRLDQDKKLVVVGLTGTPPESKSGRQKARYLNLVGEIDYQVPTPALVKEGGLAPFQDLVYFTEPTENERQFLNDQHGELHRLFAELGARGGSSDSDATGAKRNINQLNQWVSERINENKEEAWSDFVQKKPRLAIAYSRYLYAQNQPLPGNLELSESVRKAPVLEDWIEILEDYALNRLKTSAIKEDQELFKFISCAIRKIGFSLSEKGIRKSASPVDRVLAYSRSKSDAVAVILDMEYASLQDRLRALVITDFEIMSPTVIKSVETILDPDAGGAIGIMKTLLAK